MAIGMMVPSLLLQEEGIYVYKKYSFDDAKKRFRDIDFSPIDEATLIMRNWYVPNLVKIIPPRLLLVLPYYISSRAVSFVRRFSTHKKPREKPETVARITKSFYELYANMNDKYGKSI